MDIFIQCFSAFIGCFGFSFIFRIHKNIRFAIIGAIVGTLGWVIYLATFSIHNKFIQTFIAMLCISLLSEMLARICKAPATIFIIIGCFPLVPGSGIYYTMLYAVQGLNNMFIESFLETLGISFSIAFAILISSTLIQVYKRIKTKDFASIE